MTKRTQIIVAVALVALIVLVIAVAFLVRRGAIVFDGGLPSFNPVAVTTQMPSLDREIVFPDDFPENARTKFMTEVDNLKQQIRLIPLAHSAWFDLAIRYRMISDHEGAVQIWEYLRNTIPTDPISRHNLGEYYFHTEKDYDRAEKYYREALEVDPTFTSSYMDLHEMYRYATNEQDKAIAILEEGVERVNKDQKIDLIAMLASYHRDMGNTAQAIARYTEARDLARSQGNTARARQFDHEIARLK